MKQNVLVVAIISGAVCFTVGLIGGVLLTMPNREKINSTIVAIEAKAEKELQLQSDLAQAELTIERSKKEAETIISQAKKEAEDYALVQKEEMYKIYPNLREYQQGINVVNEKYLKSFRVDKLSAKDIWGDDPNLWKITFTMQNNTSTDIKPSVSILFLNKQGFITDASGATWLFSSIKSGETRIDKGQCKFRYGEPVYYSIEFR
jgi:hypothetical protein